MYSIEMPQLVESTVAGNWNCYLTRRATLYWQNELHWQLPSSFPISYLVFFLLQLRADVKTKENKWKPVSRWYILKCFFRVLAEIRLLFQRAIKLVEGAKGAITSPALNNLQRRKKKRGMHLCFCPCGRDITDLIKGRSFAPLSKVKNRANST